MPDLIHAAQAGDQQAFADLMKQHKRLMYHVAYQFLVIPEDVEDALQVAMMKAWRHLPRYRDDNFRAWLMMIVRNTCHDALREMNQYKRTRFTLVDIDDCLEVPAGETTDPEWLFIQDEAITYQRSNIAQLAALHREPIELVIFHDLSYDEAAGILGVPAGTVKSRISRGRAALREKG